MTEPEQAPLADVNLLDLAAEPDGAGAPHALGRRLPAMLAAVLKAAGLEARHRSATVTLDETGRRGFAVPAGLLAEGEAIEMSRRLGPARLLAHGQLGPARRRGMTLVLKALRREDAAEVVSVERDFYEEELVEVVVETAAALAAPLGAERRVRGLELASVLGTASPAALVRLQAGLDGLAALEGDIDGADPARAAEHLVSALEADGSCEQAASRAVQVLAALLEEDEALALGRRLHAAAPGFEPGLLLVSRLLERRGELEEAAALLGGAADVSGRAAADRAWLLLALGRHREAEAVASSGLEARAGAPEAELRELLGLALARQGRLEQAREALAGSVGLEPARAMAWANLGRCLHLLGRHEEARSAYDRASELAPTSWQVARNFAELALETGDVLRAEGLLRLWVDRRPDQLEAVLVLGDLLAAAGRLGESRALLEAAVGRFGDDPRLHALLGGVLLRDGARVEAEAHYRRALELAPDDPALLSNAALLAADRGDGPEAERLARRAVELAPADPVARKVLDGLRRRS